MKSGFTQRALLHYYPNYFVVFIEIQESTLWIVPLSFCGVLLLLLRSKHMQSYFENNIIRNVWCRCLYYQRLYIEWNIECFKGALCHKWSNSRRFYMYHTFCHNKVQLSSSVCSSQCPTPILFLMGLSTLRRHQGHSFPQALVCCSVAIVNFQMNRPSKTVLETIQRLSVLLFCHAVTVATAAAWPCRHARVQTRGTLVYSFLTFMMFFSHTNELPQRLGVLHEYSMPESLRKFSQMSSCGARKTWARFSFTQSCLVCFDSAELVYLFKLDYSVGFWSII